VGRLRAHGIFPQALRLQHGGMVSKQKSILRSTLPTLILPADGDTPWKFEATFKPGSALFMRCRAQADAFRRREETAVPYILICAQHARIHASAQLHGHVQGNEGGRCCYAAAYTQCNVQHTAVSNMLAAISSSGYYGLSVPRSTPAHGIIPLASELEPAKPRAASDPAQPPVQPPAQRHQARADRTRPSYPISYPILSYAIALSVDMGDLFLSYFKPQNWSTRRPQGF